MKFRWLSLLLATLFLVVNSSPTAEALPTLQFPSLGDRGTFSSGYTHSCLISGQGIVRCEGENGRGELSGNTISPTGFVVVPLPGRAIFVTARNYTTCALLEDRSVYCWGENTFAQVTGLSTSASERVPIQVAGLPSTITKIALTEKSGAALTESGELWTWGGMGTVLRSYYLGRGTSSATGVVTSFGVALKDFATGKDVICGLLTSGITKCFGQNWGYNIGYKQIPTQGIGDYASSSYKSITPYPAEDLPDTGKSIETVGTLFCTTMEDNSVWCWGETFRGWDYRRTASTEVSQAWNAGILRKPSLLFSANLRMTMIHNSAYSYTHCAQDQNSVVKCWGGGGLNLDNYVINPIQIPTLNRSVVIHYSDNGGDIRFIDSDGIFRTQSLESFPPWDDQTISVPNIPSVRIGEFGDVINPSSSSGLAIQFSTNSPTCEIHNNKILGRLAGGCLLTFVQTGNQRFHPITYSVEVQIIETTTTTSSTSTTTTTVLSSPSALPTSATFTPVKVSNYFKFGTTVNKSTVLRFAGMNVGSYKVIKFQIARGYAKFCRVNGTSVKTLRRGLCKISINASSKFQKTIKRTVTFLIR